MIGTAWGDQVTDLYKTEKYRLGTLRIKEHPTYGTQFYRFVYFDDAVDVTAGDVLILADDGVVTFGGVTNDHDGSEIKDTLTNSPGLHFGGVAPIANDISNGYLYGWVQIGGYCPTVRTDGNVTAGDKLVASATDGLCQVATHDTDGDPQTDHAFVFGTALTADAGSDPYHCEAYLIGNI